MRVLEVLAVLFDQVCLQGSRQPEFHDIGGRFHGFS
jgi:hypothetical protein